jgi:hypothetical protein
MPVSNHVIVQYSVLLAQLSHAEQYLRSLVYSIDTEPLRFNLFNFVQASSDQSKNYASFSTPRDLTSIYQLCHHTSVLLDRAITPVGTPTSSIALIGSRASTLRSSKGDLPNKH